MYYTLEREEYIGYIIISTFNNFSKQDFLSYYNIISNNYNIYYYKNMWTIKTNGKNAKA